MQLVNCAQFLNIIFLLALFTACSAVAVFLTVIVPLVSIHASLSPHKRDLNIEISNLT